MIEKSFAKINLGLSVFEQREDSFHNIDTIFLEIDFYDTIEIVPSDKFLITTNNANIPKESNIITRVYSFYKNNFDNIVDDYHITINKKIPIGGGLGGGSSNAACILKVLNKLWNLGLDKKELETIAINFGADVPFFIDGGCQRGRGVGEQLEPINMDFLKGKGIALITPNISISTPWAYGEIKKTLQVSDKDNNLHAPQTIEELELFENDFEKVVLSAYPEIGKIKALLISSGAYFASLSGSGSTVYGIYDEESTLDSFLEGSFIYPTVKSFLKK